MPYKENIYFDMYNQYNLISDNFKKSEGIVYTPPYIAKYIIKNTISVNNIYNKKILDPCVGGGIFIIELLSFLYESNIDIEKIIPNIYCFDINEDRIKEATINIKKYLHSINISTDFKIKKQDFLNFKDFKFDYIIGNPPYINSHNLPKDIISQLKTNFYTTKNGNSNIFYAFIEHSIKLLLNNKSKVGFIVPNNFLYIKSANRLRDFLLKGQYINKIVDLGINLPFSPIRTYNAIVFCNLDNSNLKFSNLDKSNCLKDSLDNCKFSTINYSDLSNDMWYLMDKKKIEKIKSLEDPFLNVGRFVKTGIATLKDKVYIFNNSESDYLYKSIDGKTYKIEKKITKDFYKISELKEAKDLQYYRKKIIYPYKNLNGKIILINEKELADEYPFTYEYLLSQKPVLLNRDSNKIPLNEWYKYGRSQGLDIKNNYKIFFKTFNNKPTFILSDLKECLFSNGYCIELTDYNKVIHVLKILNSEILDFYIRNTSYAIEGGYYCYQKKYIEKFALGF